MIETQTNAPGRSDREGVSLLQLFAMFPNERAAERWFEQTLWQGARCCGHCGSLRTRPVPHRKPMPYWCSDCRAYFSVRTGTAIARSNVPLRKWAIAIYLCLTSLKSVSSMKLHRDINVSQKTAWFMLMRIREAWATETNDPYRGPVEADETYVGGRQRNMHEAQRAELAGGGTGHLTAVAGVRDRSTNRVSATAVRGANSETLQGFVAERTEPDAMVYTDESRAYRGLPRAHETVRHSVGEYVRGEASTNGMESF